MTISTTPDAGQGSPGRRSARPPLLTPARRRGAGVVLVVLTVLTVLIAMLAMDAALLTARVHRFDADDVHGAGKTTWVLVGLDSRDDLPAGGTASDFGTSDQVPGSRADVVLVLQHTDSGLTALSVPRDVVVRTDHRSGRLALTWLRGPQATIDGLCQLGIPTGHLITVDLGGFAAIVDAVGGLDVDVPSAVRDPAAGLDLPSAGRQHVDGATALALIRSRHPEHLVDGAWVPAPVDPDGRATAAGTVLSALSAAVRHSASRPWQLQRVAWAGTDAVTVDSSTSMADLFPLARADLGQVRVLPVGAPVNGTIARHPTAETAAAVSAAGMSCTR
jgi:LCP family protein required for cell wall assembly